MTILLLEMNELAFMRAASAATDGLTDYGDESFREPLRVLIADPARQPRDVVPEGLWFGCRL